MWDCWVSPGDKQGLCSFHRLYMGLFMKYFDHHVKWRPIMLVFAGSRLPNSIPPPTHRIIAVMLIQLSSKEAQSTNLVS